ncbi:YjbF family lipoprotein [Sulfitobacter aestuarii]|uniref:YjbF family lipoprotein n=1 Tax=Sulfitobacter aestuarii TaxID=2161676 RepID=A0ABW5TYP4_9RHOB
MTGFARACALLAAAILAGCSSDGSQDREINALAVGGSAVLQTLQTGRPAKDAAKIRVEVTPALLAATPGAVLEVVPERLGLQDFLQRIEIRRDVTPGVVEVWKSSDDAHVILRDGVLVATKGFGGDLRSGEARTAVAGFDGEGGGGARLLVIDRLDGSAQNVHFSCEMVQLGRQDVTIAGQQIPTRRIRENCHYRDFSFTNDYWVEIGSGQLHQSRQWAGPHIGYLKLRRLKG